jgi:hypothetical protein
MGGAGRHFSPLTVYGLLFTSVPSYGRSSSEFTIIIDFTKSQELSADDFGT